MNPNVNSTIPPVGVQSLPSSIGTGKPNPTVYKSWNVTEIKATEFCFSWTIKNFSLCTQKIGEKLESLSFFAGRKDEYEWRLRTYPAGENEETEDFLSLDLILVSCPGTEAWTKYKLYVINTNGEKIAESRTPRNPINIGKGRSSGSSNFIFFDRLQKNAIASDLTVICEGSISGDRVDTSVRNESLEPAARCTLSDDFGSLFETKELSDIVLSVGDKKLPAHKAILATRSSVFAAMFKYKMTERERNEVVIEDIEYEILEEVLRYIYTGKSQNMREMADKLLPAADKYNLNGLKLMCQEFLCSTLAVANVINLLIFADTHCAVLLKVKAIHFLNTHINDVICTTGWKDMASKYPYLLAQAFEAQAAK